MPLAAATSQRIDAGLDPARLWLAGFPPACLAFFVMRPGAAMALAALGALSLLLCTAAMVAVTDEKGGWRRGHDFIAAAAPLHFAAAIWLSVVAASSMTHAAFPGLAASIAAIPVSLGLLIAILSIEAALSAALLLLARSSGEPVALLVSAKHAGVFGRLN